VLATVLMVGGFFQHVSRLLKYSSAACAALAILWFTYAAGASPVSYTQLITPTAIWTAGVATLPAFLASRLNGARGAFEISPGGTNLAAAPVPEFATTGDAPLPTQPSAVRRIVFGVTALAVPISIMRVLGLVSFSGGRGLLLIADVDTIFLDITIVAILVILARRFKQVRRNWALALTGVLLGGLIAILLGYVVTNYGALFRLRLIAAMPLWLLPLAATDDAISEPAAQQRVAIGPTFTSRSVQ
jgi:hypothetical protein